MLETTIQIKIPSDVTFGEAQLTEMSALNPDVDICFSPTENVLLISEKNFVFTEVDFFEVHTGFPFNDARLEELWSLNDELKIETNPDGTLIINMDTVAVISTLTLLISGTLFVWNQMRKAGRVTEGTGGFYLKKQGKNRIPDVAFTSFEKMLREQQVRYRHSRTMPDLCIEVVSNKSRTELNKNLKKMQSDWIAEGVDVGIVVDPYDKKYHVFDENSLEGTPTNFSIIFTHKQFPGLILDFDDLLTQAIDQNPDVEFP